MSVVFISREVGIRRRIVLRRRVYKITPELQRCPQPGSPARSVPVVPSSEVSHDCGMG